ncbi:MAG TPA: Rrf2 family transcriptional regulator [Bacteroidota bacterium]|nr:Rrf2 family transcriptional regulator [Bacteroidota bacterium]
MSLLFSRECEYAIQAVTYLARYSAESRTSIRQLARTLKIPHHFLAKILQRLTQKGILVSTKGPSGGFALAVPAEEITVFHIVDAVDGVGFTNQCILGFPECSGKNPCALHEQWGGIRENIYTLLVSRNLSQVGEAMKKPEYEQAAATRSART